MSLLEYRLLTFSSLFVIVDPIAVVPAFLAMTPNDPPAAQLRMARLACAVAAGVLMLFALAAISTTLIMHSEARRGQGRFDQDPTLPGRPALRTDLRLRLANRWLCLPKYPGLGIRRASIRRADDQSLSRDGLPLAAPRPAVNTYLRQFPANRAFSQHFRAGMATAQGRRACSNAARKQKHETENES